MLAYPSRSFRLAALAEGITLLVLVLIAMPLKHFAGMGLATRVVGIVHGAAFLAYVACLLDAWGVGKLGRGDALKAFVAAFLPGGTLWLFWRDARVTSS